MHASYALQAPPRPAPQVPRLLRLRHPGNWDFRPHPPRLNSTEISGIKMSAKLLDCIEIQTGDPCEYSVIWLHGLGASGHDFEPIVPSLELLSRPGVRFLFPHAPVRPISVNGGASMRAWYDISSIDFESREQDALEASGVKPEWHTYSIAHSVSAEEVADISIWLKRQFGM